MLSKFRELQPRMLKRIGALVLLGALILGGATACTTPMNNPTNPTGDGTQTPTSPTSPSNSGSQGSSPNQGTEKHSDLLMSVVNDKYYKSLMSKNKNYTAPAFDPHPYAFLEDEGIDIDKILDGTYLATTMSFVLDDEPNNLYINTRILVGDSHYQSYLITYKLTDKEMADYRLIHGNKASYSYTWPAFFINDKISETKQPTKVLQTKYSLSTHEIFQSHLDSAVNIREDYIIPSIDLSNKTYVFILYPLNNKAHVATASKSISFFEFKYPRLRISDNVYVIGQNYMYAELLSKEIKQATTFDLQSTSIFRGKDFETVIGKS